jgi:hypothetical protein
MVHHTVMKVVGDNAPCVFVRRFALERGLLVVLYRRGLGQVETGKYRQEGGPGTWLPNDSRGVGETHWSSGMAEERRGAERHRYAATESVQAH